MSFQSYGQIESLISSIRNIIKDYPFESVIKEFLQNADDAGATRFHVIVDERSHSTNSLFHNEMRDWQGPAILMYNNAKFKESDFKSLMQIRVGGKQDDDTKIGKFGLGFNSCYNLTDLPSFISGDSIAFLDPQEKFLPKDSNGNGQHGIIGSIPKNGIRGYELEDQFVPFEGIEGLDFQSTFEGTLFRIPLRQQPGKISESVYSTFQVLKLIDNIKSRFSSQFLFLRNVEIIEMSHIREVTFPLQIHSLWKATVIELNENVRDQRKRVNDGIFQIFQLKIELIDNANHKQNDHWIIATGAQQNPEDPQLKKYAKQYRLRVLGGIAALLESSRIEFKKNFTGRMYSFFQLPDITHLPFHLNGTWAQGSDRGMLLMDKDDLPDLDHQKLNWNRHILLDFLPKLYCKFLEEAIKLQKSQKIKFKEHPILMFWPFPSTFRNYPKYVFEYSCKVLKHILQNGDIFRLFDDDDSFNENDRANVLFKFFPGNQILEKNLRSLLRKSIKSFSELIKSDPGLKSVFRSLPIWKTLDPLRRKNSPLKPASCGHILTTFKMIEYYKTKDSIIYLNHDDGFEDQEVLIELGVPKRDIYTYFFEDVEFPNKCDDQYLSFLKSILKLDDNKLLNDLKDFSCFPTMSNKIKKITGLYDYNNNFFRNMFGENPDIFLHNELSNYAIKLSKIGLKSKVNQAIYVDFAKKIENLQEELDSSSDIRLQGVFMVKHLYDNIDILGLATLENVMRIPIVPISKILDKQYSMYYKHTQVLDCFKNIILFTYKEVAWSQMPLIPEDVMPPKKILQRYPWLGKPDAPTVIKHLRFLYNIIRNDDEWKNNWSDVFNNNVNEVYKWLEKECRCENLDLLNFIRPSEKLFLNFKKNQDPFDTDNWVSATDLILNSEPGDEKYIDQSLAKHSNMLKSAGVKEIKLPNIKINVREHDQSYINTVFTFLLDQEFPLHDITFIVNDDKIKASQCILAASSKFFHQRFNSATIIIEDIEPNSMHILLRYLYGQNIEDAIQKRRSLTNDNEYYKARNCITQEKKSPSNMVVLYKDLLKLSNKFELDHLKELMERRLSRFVNRTNVENMKSFAETSSANQLKDFCNLYIHENSNLLYN